METLPLVSGHYLQFEDSTQKLQNLGERSLFGKFRFVVEGGVRATPQKNIEEMDHSAS